MAVRSSWRQPSPLWMGAFLLLVLLPEWCFLWLEKDFGGWAGLIGAVFLGWSAVSAFRLQSFACPH